MIMSLQTETGGQLGFILFAPKDETRGECIVRALPTNSEIIGTDEYRHLCVLSDSGECTYEFENGRDLVTIIAADRSRLRFERAAPGGRHAETATDLKLFGELIAKK